MSTQDYRTHSTSDGTFLNRLKNQIREVTKTLDQTTQKFQPSLEVTSVKHEIEILKASLGVHGLLPEQVKIHTNVPAQTDEAVIVEMTYVGQYTKTKLWTVSQGTETLATLKRQRRLLSSEYGDLPLSFDEAISLLERREGTQKTPGELKTEIARYRTAIKNIEREPDAYVAPEIAQNWYKQQIERISKQMQAVEESSSLVEVSQ